MKQTMRYLSMAAIAVAGAIMSSCTSDDLVAETLQPETGNTNPLTITVSLDDGGAQTRALTAAGVKTFAENDQIALIYTNTSGKTKKLLSNAITSASISANGKKAKFTFADPLDNPKADGSARLIYPAVMAKTTIDASATIDDDGTIDYNGLYNSQYGLLDKLPAYDLTTWDGTLSELQITSGSIDSGNMPKLTNRLAICEFTIKDGGGANITDNFDVLTINDGVNTYRVNGGGNFSSTAPVYVAMIPVSGKDITFSATKTTSATAYVKTVTGKTLDAGNMYPVNLKMTQTAINLEALTGDYVAQNGDILTGTLDGASKKYKISIANGAKVTLCNATINGVIDGSCLWAGISCVGDAEIVLSGANTVKGFLDNFPGIYVPGNGNSGSNNTLTISGTGSLYASSNGLAAGIGGGAFPCGNIVITGGTVTAQGGADSAGIGSGKETSCGNITISGGTVTAQGGRYSAGIGGELLDITISGGTVTAMGGQYGAGIGSGDTGDCNDITISGGTVIAQGGDDSAGIGTGLGGNCDDITITTGVTSVTATRGLSTDMSSGSGFYPIGLGGKEYYYSPSCETVTFGGLEVWYSSWWTETLTDGGTYGGLKFAVTTKNVAEDTWILRPNN